MMSNGSRIWLNANPCRALNFSPKWNQKDLSRLICHLSYCRRASWRKRQKSCTSHETLRTLLYRIIISINYIERRVMSTTSRRSSSISQMIYVSLSDSFSFTPFSISLLRNINASLKKERYILWGYFVWLVCWVWKFLNFDLSFLRNDEFLKIFRRFF